jgi:hypothetical protein
MLKANTKRKDQRKKERNKQTITCGQKHIISYVEELNFNEGWEVEAKVML